MVVDRDALKALQAQVSFKGILPPRSLLHAMASIVGDAKPEHVISVYAQESEEWRAAALVDAGIASAIVTTRRLGSGDTEESVDASLIPLTEVTACEIAQIYPGHDWETQGPSLFEWWPRWSVRLRDRSTLDLPWHEGEREMDQHALFAAALIASLPVRSHG